MKIIISNVYSFRNRGDSAIVEAMIHYFRSKVPQGEIFLSSTFWEENKAYYEQLNVRSVPLLWDIPMTENKVLRLLQAFWALAVLVLQLGLPKSWLSSNSMVRKYREADLLIDAGGGSFFSSNKYFFYLGFYQHLLNLLAGRWCGIPVTVAPQSMGPFNKKHDVVSFRHVMRKLNTVMVRESISSALMKELNAKSIQVPDCAFLANFVVDISPVALRSLDKIEKGRINIGLTVLDWSWAIASRTETTCSEYLIKISGALHGLDDPKLTIHLFSQTDVATERSDHHVAEELSMLLETLKIRNVVHDPENTASDLCHLYRRMDCFVGSRMHSCIFAVTQAVPVVALAYQPKTLGVLNWVSDVLHILSIDTFESKQLETALRDTLINRDSISEELKDRSSELKEMVREQFDKQIMPLLQIARS